MRPRIALIATAVLALVLGLNGPASPEVAALSAPTAVVPPQAPASPQGIPRWTPPPVPEPEIVPLKIDPTNYHKGHGPNLSERVVLTYDDCPRTLGEYQEVLAYAKASNIGLVIAPTGACYHDYLKQGADIVLLARQHGQYVINHSITHPNLTKVGAAKAKAQISGDVQADYGRPPYGAHNQVVDNVYADAKMRLWLWDVDTNDWRGKSPDQVVGFAVTHACKGCTVLMHLQHKGFSVTAIRAIDAGLKARGLETCRAYRGWDNTGPVLTAPALLGDNALPC